MIHPHTALRLVDDLVGWGVFATKLIPKGTVIWARDPLDQAIDPQRIARLGPLWRRWSEHHTFADSDGHRILCWDLCRSMNHSCRPTCGGTELGFELALVDLAPGDELTNDYCTLGIEASEGFLCRCGSPQCRGQVEPDASAIERLRPQVLAALDCAPAEQALDELLSGNWRERALETLTRRATG